MSGLLKAGDRTAQSAVKRLGAVPLAPREPSPVLPAPERERREPEVRPGREAIRNDELDRQCMELEATIAELRHRLHETEAGVEARTAEALERGRQEGKAEAESGERLRLETLATALAEAGRELRARLDDCELLALQLARAAVARLFGKAEGPGELVSAALANHLTRVKPDLVVGIRVSPDDFPDEAALSTLAAGHGGLAVTADGNLESGECEIDLKLGKIDIGLGGQWERLSRYFDELANEERLG